MNRRSFLSLALAGAAGAGGSETGSLAGVLQLDQGRPVLKAPDGRLVRLEGDAPTMAVLGDARLHGRRFEVVGTPLAPDRFRVGPIHLKSMFVLEQGRRLMISYWCDVCSIRTYAPGKCQCCQEETELELRPAADN